MSLDQKSNRPYRTRGRIAEVLAEARASLQDPSRPITPASLDARTSLDIHSYSKTSFSGINTINNTNPSISSKPMSLHNLLAENWKNSLTNNKKTPLESQSEKYNNSETTYQKANLPTKSDKFTQSLQLLLHDINDAIQRIENEIYRSTSSLDQDCNELFDTLNSMTIQIDTFSKNIKSGKISESIQKEVNQTSHNIYQILSRIFCGNFSLPCRHLSARHALRISLTQLESILKNSPSPSSSPSSSSSLDSPSLSSLLRASPLPALPSEVVVSLISILQALYGMMRVEDSTTGSSSSSCVSTPSSSRPQTSSRPSTSTVTPEGRPSSSNSSSTNPSLSSEVGANGMDSFDLVLLFLNLLWGVVGSHGYLLSDPLATESESNNQSQRSMKNQSQPHRNNNRNKNNHDSSNYNYNSESNPTPTPLSEEEMGLWGIQTVLLSQLLEAGSFAAGIIRSHSNSEQGRRRMTHLGAIDSISAGIKTSAKTCYQQFAASHSRSHSTRPSAFSFSSSNLDMSASSSFTGSFSSSMINPSTSSPSDQCSSLLISLLSRVLVQCVAAARNFTLENQGRNQLLQSKICVYLCILMRVLRDHPDLLLTCARVIAKLSLLEPFRAQINSKGLHVKCLVDCLLREAHLCEQQSRTRSNQAQSQNSSSSDFFGEDQYVEEEVGDEEGEERKKQESLWPGWHSLPLLSRVAFSLGNLTTTNNTNRRLIAFESKSLRPLITLLQYSSTSINKLYQSRSEEVGEEDAGERGDNDGQIRASRRRRSEGFDIEDSEDEEGGDKSINDSYEEEDFEEEEEEDYELSEIFGRPNQKGRKNSKNQLKNPSKKSPNNSPSLSTHKQASSSSSSSTSQIDTISSPQEAELLEAAVRLLRLLANLSIDEEVGGIVGSRVETYEMLTELLGCVSHPNISISSSSSSSPLVEELLLNVVATCTNLTYYTCNFLLEPTPASRPSTSSAPSRPQSASLRKITPSSSSDPVTRLESLMTSLSLHLSHCLFHSHDDIVLEAARAMGNLTRTPRVLQSLLPHRTPDALLLLLSHPNHEIISAVSGALVNISADRVCALSLLTESACPPLPPLLAVLRRMALKNLPLSTLICQVLHNLLSIGNQREEEEEEEEEDHPSPSYHLQIVLRNLPPKNTLFLTLQELVECAEDLHTSRREEKEKDMLERKTKKISSKSKTEIIEKEMIGGIEEEESGEEIQFTDFILIGKSVLDLLERFEFECR